MLPGMNPRQMAQAMRRMGIQQKELDAVEVIIRTAEKDIIIKNPHVAKIEAMGQQTYQVTGEEEERPKEVERPREADISEEDIRTVMEQTSKDRETVIKVIGKNKGDLAASILELR